jgi:Cu(I)/Ag(I) efflux system membrane fusion protein
MNRAILMSLVVAALAAAVGAGFTGGRVLHGTSVMSFTTAAASETTTAPIYYRDPDGKPFYSLTPKRAEDGRAYRPVPPGADVSFDDPAHEKTEVETPDAKVGERKIKYYRNPMGLPDRSSTPKKDSMGMDYIPVYEGEDAADGSVKLSPGKIQRTGVQCERAAPRVIRTLIRAPGTIQLDERRISVISMRTESWVQKVMNVTTGSAVKKGQPLMEIYSSAISSAAADYISTINLSIPASMERYGRGSRQRLMNLDVPDAAIVAMEKSRMVPIAIEWSAPRDGIVLERNAIEGMRAQPGDVLFRVADTSLVWAMVDVAERDLGAVRVGQRITAKARSFPERAFSGKISVIYPQVNRETRTARVRVELSNPDLVLLPDMYVDAEIDTGNPAPVLAIPESAVLDTGARQSVLVDKGEGRFEPREVKLGQRGNGYVEVREGVHDGEPVVVSANFLIDAESNLRAALNGFSEAGSQP